MTTNWQRFTEAASERPLRVLTSRLLTRRRVIDQMHVASATCR